MRALRPLCVAVWLGLSASLALAAAAGPPPPERAGDTARDVVIDAARQERDGHVLVARGQVRLTYQDIVLEAEEIQYDERTREVVATGNVMLAERDRRIAGERIEFNLDTRLGRVHEVWGYSSGDVFFSAREAEKQGPDRYHLDGPAVSSCTQPTPQWRIRASSGTYEVDKYVRLWNARLEVFGVPLVWLPVFQYPAKRERSTGFLFPSFGTNDKRGFYVSNAFFWAIGRSYDATFIHEYYDKRGSVFREEFNYVPAANANGSFVAENSYDKLDERSHAAYSWVHNQRLGQTWRLGADVHYATDETLDREFTQDFNRYTQRARTSRGYLERNWSRYSARLSGYHSVLFAESGSADSERTDMRLPSAEFSVRETQLLGPLYGRLGSSATRFGQQYPGQERFTWERLDLDPAVSLPLQPTPWLQLRPRGGYRMTWYSKSYEAGSNRQVRTDDNYLRGWGNFGADLVGPTFARVFDRPGGGYAEKFKHVIEPAVSYSYAEEVDPDQQALVIDGVDQVRSANFLTYQLRNRLFAKRVFAAGLPAAPMEILSLNLTMNYDMQDMSGRVPPADRRRSPVRADLRFVPNGAWTVTYQAAYDTYDDFWQSQSLQGSLRGEEWNLDLAFVRNRNQGSVLSSQVRGGGVAELFNRRLQVGGGLLYDFLQDSFLQFRGSAVYRTQCCGLGIGYNRIRLGARDDRELRFSFSLRNVGTVFDYTTGGDN